MSALAWSQQLGFSIPDWSDQLLYPLLETSSSRPVDGVLVDCADECKDRNFMRGLRVQLPDNGHFNLGMEHIQSGRGLLLFLSERLSTKNGPARAWPPACRYP